MVLVTRLRRDQSSQLSRSAKLRRLLDVAATHEPARSEEGAGVGETGHLSPRQLGGIVLMRVALATSLCLVTVWSIVRESLSWRECSQGAGGAAEARCRRRGI